MAPGGFKAADQDPSGLGRAFSFHSTHSFLPPALDHLSMDDALSPRAIISIADIVSDARLANHLAASALVILLLDLFSTLENEINFVWNKPWRVPSILYVWNRYMSLLTVFVAILVMFHEVKSDEVCKSFILTGCIVSALLFGTFNLMLTLRVWILYGQQGCMDYILSAMLLVQILSMIIPPLVSAAHLRDFVHLGPMVPGCSFTRPFMSGIRLAFYFLPQLLVTSTMFILILRKCITTLRLRGRNYSSAAAADLPIIRLLLRDGIIWFAIVSFFNIAQLVIWSAGRTTMSLILIIPSVALFSLISSRFLLSTKSLSSPKSESSPEYAGLETEDDDDDEPEKLKGSEDADQDDEEEEHFHLIPMSA
ncbi:hypothetical protein FB45DRAFT_922219 [Roridomyces roridus]|uniref:DUF6533 domain-containing protein n=1 Tax=Roridomyces roridus TaxID=1738132 RepID=A0AAD7BMX2_9AGAR|nr:hypothetical protein FB45DRAFT_922219 [Roridomyces roridus]